MQHTDFAEAKLQKRLFTSSLEESEVDQLAVLAMSGIAAEAMQFEEVLLSVLLCLTRVVLCACDCSWQGTFSFCCDRSLLAALGHFHHSRSFF